MNNELMQRIAVLNEHDLYSNIKNISDLKLFMESHVFAVWDFMSLAKRLQSAITCVDVPWIPPKDSASARLINEIILYEETDKDYDGIPSSHLEMYLQSMDEVGANTSVFRKFLAMVGNGDDITKSLEKLEVPIFVMNFVKANINIAINGSDEEVAANFLYGREDSIPKMFTNLLKKWHIKEESVPKLTHYLKRHIALDGDDHGPAAHRILEKLISGSNMLRKRAEKSAIEAVENRIMLWDGILGIIAATKNSYSKSNAVNAI